MFNSLSGEVTGRGPGVIFLSTAGVEWELEVSGFTLRQLAQATTARVFTHLHHREDQMSLYGFSSKEERRVFLELTRVSGIGPKAALKILSSSTPDRILQMLASEDVDGLVMLPGLGKKTAQKIILTLRGRLVEGAAPSDSHAELVEGLVEMGFDRSAAAKVVAELASSMEPGAATSAEQEQELFRQSIIRLSEDTSR